MGLNRQENRVAGPSKIQSDFERVFKPFVLGKDKVLAPQNWFHDQRKRRRRAVEVLDNGAIIIGSEDERDMNMSEPQPTEEEICAMSPRSK